MHAFPISQSVFYGYWKDATFTELLFPAVPSGNSWGAKWISGISVDSSGTAYCTGAATNDAGVTYAYYWNGSTAVPLPVGATQSLDAGNGITAVYVNGIFVKSGNVYVAGAWVKAGVAQACYWLNGAVTNFLGADTGKDSFGNGIYVDGSTVYTVGTVNNDGTNDAACYWSGSTRTTLPLSTSGLRSWGNAIVATWGTVYTAGDYNNNGSTFGGSYWNGTTRNDVSIPSTALGVSVAAIAMK